MDELLEAIATLVYLISPEKIQAIVNRIRTAEVNKSSSTLLSIVGTPLAKSVINQLTRAWQTTAINSEALALMLLTASHMHTRSISENSIELVWTGPTTPFVSARRTEQVLLQVINSAKSSLFITSFVAYDVPTIINAFNAANERGVSISMLLELSKDHGGGITFDAIGKMRKLVPSAKLYAWKNKSDVFSDGHVHAKVVIADGEICFITSANLTGYAMEKNIEAGVLISAGQIPKSLNEHLKALVATNIVTLI